MLANITNLPAQSAAAQTLKLEAIASSSSSSSHVSVGNVSSAYFLGNDTLHPGTSMNIGRQQSHKEHRYPPVPNFDPGLTHNAFSQMVLHDYEYCQFLSDKCPIEVKVNSSQDPNCIGHYNSYSAQLSINLAPPEPVLGTDDRMTSLAAAAGISPVIQSDASDSFSSYFPCQYPVQANWLELKKKEADPQDDEPQDHLTQTLPFKLSLVCDVTENVFPVSAELELKATSFPPEGSHWLNSIQGYRRLVCHAPSGITPESDILPLHYENIRGKLDPYFKCGLFGELSNGLSVVMLALLPRLANLARNSSASLTDALPSSRFQAPPKVEGTAAEPDKKRLRRAEAEVQSNHNQAHPHLKAESNLLREYIELVCIQFWSLLNDRYLEADPNVQLNDKWRPSYLLMLFHNVDFAELKKHAGRKVYGVDQPPISANMDFDQMVALARPWLDKNHQTQPSHLLSFVHDVLTHVSLVMAEFATTHPLSILGTACRQLNFFEDVKDTLLKNHTQFLTVCKFKNNFIPDFFRHPHASLYLEKDNVKFFPAHSATLGVIMPLYKLSKAAPTSEALKNPYFWSHLVISPDAPIVKGEIEIFGRGAQEDQSLSSDEVVGRAEHQWCILRRLAHCVSRLHMTTIQKIFCEESNQVSIQVNLDPAPAPVTITSKDFYSICITNLKQTTLSTSEIHRTLMSIPFLLPPVISPVHLRYAMAIDRLNDRAIHYIPAMGRNVAQMSRVDESDISCMPKHYFLAMCLKASKTFEDGQHDNKMHLLTDKNQAVFMKLTPQHEAIRTSINRIQSPVITRNAQLAEYKQLFPCVALDKKVSLPDDCKEDSNCRLFISTERVPLHELEFQQLQLHFRKTGAGPRPLQKASEQPRFKKNAYYLWTLLEKVQGATVDDVVTAANFLKLMTSQPARKWDEKLILQCFNELQVSAIRAKNQAWSQFVYTSSCTPALERMVQQRLLHQIDLDWNRCTAPKLDEKALQQFVIDMAHKDVQDMEFYLKPRNHPAVQLDKGDVAKMCEFIIRNPANNLLRPQTVSDMYVHINKPLPVLPAAARYQFVCKVSDEASLLKTHFEQFFGRDTPEKAWHTMLVLVMFLVWRSHTHYLQPLKQVLSMLYPESSYVRITPKQHYALTAVPSSLSSLHWTAAMKPFDMCLQIGKVAHNVFTLMLQPNFVAELETLVRDNCTMSNNALASLLVFHRMTRLQSDLQLERQAGSDLRRVEALMSKLLEGREELVNTVDTSTGNEQTIMMQATRRCVIISDLENMVKAQVAFFNDFGPWEVIHQEFLRRLSNPTEIVSVFSTVYYNVYLSADNRLKPTLVQTLERFSRHKPTPQFAAVVLARINRK